MSRPETTVVITAYNYSAYLEECLRSIDAQTESPERIVVVDDASTDDTASVLDRVLQTLDLSDRVTIHRNPERIGAAASLNLAFGDLVDTELVANVDADDTVEPRFVESLKNTLIAHPEASYTYPRLRLFGAQTGDYATQPFNPGRLMFGGNYIPNVVLIRRDHVLDVGGYRDLDTHIDWDLWLALLARGYTGILTDEVLYNWRRHPGAMSQQPKLRLARTRARIQWHHRRLLAAHPAAAVRWTVWAVMRRTGWGRSRYHETLTESGWIETDSKPGSTV